MLNKWQYLLFIPLFGLNASIESSLASEPKLLIAQESTEQILKTDTENNYCNQEVASLTNLLLKDLPNYSNRIIQRTQNLSQNAGISTFIVAAGQGQFKALELPQFQYSPASTESTESAKQIFFTVLERQYIEENTGNITNKIASQPPTIRKLERQTYHWLFLTPTNDGWRMVTMFSRFGSASQDNLPTPPQESSNGIIGQAVQLWLKDCRAGQFVS
ncbi:hypothetical protein Xen7305DRAFT_00004090 [Xenococcus sp. PCC 7305]|nr:hypothetical protein Xen7305DRAFT_00004090 [Xenococcus sp. PCC 7305]